MRIARTTTLITAATAEKVGFGQAEIMAFSGEKSGFAHFDGQFRPTGEIVMVCNPWSGPVQESTIIGIDEVKDAFDAYMVVAVGCK